MIFDISTHENQLKSLNIYQEYLLAELNAALNMHENLHGSLRQEALDAVDALERIRRHISQKADELGYADACINEIPDCSGECCKWHFPKDLNRFDLFITLCSLSTKKKAALKRRLKLTPQKYQCPFVEPNGCIFSFTARPLVCANAYPCFLGGEYHAFLQSQKSGINDHLNTLKRAQESLMP